MKSKVVRKLTIGEGMPKICVPIVEKTSEEILQAAHEIKHTSADLVEWRVDWFESVMDTNVVKKVAEELREVLGDMPLLFTFRTRNEGGEKEILYDKYAELLCQIADTKHVDMIDVEVFMNEGTTQLIEELQRNGMIVVGSNHDFAKTPHKEEIIRRICYMQEVGVDIPKIAVMPQNAEDVLTLLDATREMATDHADRPIVTMSMAGLGAVSRVAGEVFGSSITFGSVKKASAPGQINIEELRKMLETLHIDRRA